ncbi:MAG: hypothetical protein AMXMBFR12_09780 [Candidatus Babeliales bacterium]
MNQRITTLAVLITVILQSTVLYAPDVVRTRFVPSVISPTTVRPVRQFIQETAEDVEQALVNFHERVSVGPEIVTLRGRQITLSDMPTDIRRNRQIYNDIAELQIQINKTIQTVMDRQRNPILQNKVEVELKELLDLLAFAGVRYNQVSNFTLFRQRVIELRQDLRDSYNAYEIANPNNYYMGVRFKLETLMSEIENLLKTLLVR